MAKSRSKGDSGFHPEKGPRIKPRQGRLCFVFGIPCPFTFAATLGPRPDLFVRLLFGFLRLFSISPSRRPLDQGDWHRERDGDPEKPLRVESATRNTSSVSASPTGCPGCHGCRGCRRCRITDADADADAGFPFFFSFLVSSLPPPVRFGDAREDARDARDAGASLFIGFRFPIYQHGIPSTLPRCSRGCQGCQGC